MYILLGVRAYVQRHARLYCVSAQPAMAIYIVTGGFTSPVAIWNLVMECKETV